ncbi:hypothetical protein Mh1956_12630 [Mannheimia haemolytica]
MFITFNVNYKDKPVVVNTDKVCSIENINGNVTVHFCDNTKLIMMDFDDKEYASLLNHLHILNQLKRKS